MRGETPELLLSARGLRLAFPRRPGGPKRPGTAVQALRGVDLDVFRGDAFALVGESGSGKTTLARCLLRLVEPCEGEVHFRGKDVLRMDRNEIRGFRRKAQIVFQDPQGSLNPRLRAGAMLEETLRVHGQAPTSHELRGKVQELLQLVGLHLHHAGRYPHQLSGGQRQRLALARALSVEPELLILDEPVSALDLSVQAQIINLLEELRDGLSLTLVLVAHDLTVVRQVAERVAVMYLGRVVETAPVSEMFAAPAHPYTRGLLAAARAMQVMTPETPPGGGNGESHPTGDSSWKILPGEPPDPASPPDGCPFHPRCPHPRKDRECALRAPELVARTPRRQVACWKETDRPNQALTRL